ncbi:hypothetical protein ABZU45_39865 [Streptomyces avermitilis]|uniref:hypothetical protein n=1 Tax=Streptomyces avermitilis TaxID=33903 RepID=UPI0033AE9B1A
MERPEVFGDAVVSCEGSLAIVDLLGPGAQMEFMEFDEPAAEEEPVGPLGTMALF